MGRFAAQGAALAVALRVFRRDGGVVALIAHDRDLSFAGTTFRASPGMTFLDIQQTADLAPDHAAMETTLHASGFEAADLDAGRYAGARAEIWRVDTEDTAARLLLAVGTIGEIERRGDRLLIEFRGLAQALLRPAGRVYQASCDAVLGDGRCGVDLLDPRFFADVTVAHHEALTVDVTGGAVAADRLFALGVAEVRSGAMAGARMPVRAERTTADGRSLTLWEAPARNLDPGTELRLTAGCDKRFATCRDRFGNAARFAGFPFIPGTSVLAVAGGGR